MGRALVRDPLLFLFDEPLSNLDAKLRVDMRTEIKKLHHRVGKTTVYVTHDQVEAMTLASRIAVMHLGEVQQFDEPEVVYNRPANMFVAGFMGSPSMNFISAEMGSAEGKAAVNIPLAGGGVASLAASQRRRPARARRRPRGPRHPARASLALQRRTSTTSPGSRPSPRRSKSWSRPGAETMAVLRIADREVVGRFSPDEAPKMGEQMKLAVDMTRACLFDPATQRLI